MSAIHIPSFNPSILVSGEGDPYLNIWDWRRETSDLNSKGSVGNQTTTEQKRKRLRGRNGGGATGGRCSLSLLIAMTMKEWCDYSGKENYDPENGRAQSYLTDAGLNWNSWSALCYYRFIDDSESDPDVKLLDLNKPILDFEPTPDNRSLAGVDHNWTSSHDKICSSSIWSLSSPQLSVSSRSRPSHVCCIILVSWMTNAMCFASDNRAVTKMLLSWLRPTKCCEMFPVDIFQTKCPISSEKCRSSLFSERVNLARRCSDKFVWSRRTTLLVCM